MTFKGYLLAGIAAATLTGAVAGEARANAFTQTNTMRASADLGRIVNLQIVTNQAHSLGSFRYFSSTTGGTRYYGFGSSSGMPITKSGEDTFTCSGTEAQWHNSGTFEVDQTGTLTPGLVVVKGEPNYQVRVTLGGPDMEVSSNRILLRNGSESVWMYFYASSPRYEGLGVRAGSGYYNPDLYPSAVHNGTWNTDEHGNIALCFGGFVSLPGDSDFVDGTYSATMEVTFSYE